MQLVFERLTGQKILMRTLVPIQSALATARNTYHSKRYHAYISSTIRQDLSKQTVYLMVTLAVHLFRTSICKWVEELHRLSGRDRMSVRLSIPPYIDFHLECYLF